MPSSKRKSQAQQKPPDGMVRYSQLVGTYGPGAMMDLVHDAVLIAGIDRWSYTGSNQAPIQEPRLRDALVQKNRQLRLNIDGPFQAPPVGKGDQPSYHCGIPAQLFPGWAVCQNLGCRELVPLRHLEKKGDKRLHCCDDGNRWPAVPVRFVAACPNGHIEDFPWSYFVHGSGSTCAGGRLHLREGSAGDFSEIEVSCKGCGAKRPLSNALAKDANPSCGGRRPWLSFDDKEPCDQHLRLLVRSASNGYFPKVVSALSIPERGHALTDVVKKNWNVLQAATPQLLPGFRNIPDVHRALQAYDDAAVLDCIAALKAGEGPPRQELRTAEYEQFTAQPKEKVGETPGVDDHDFFARTLNTQQLPQGILQVVLVHRLREVRALVGFTRLEADSPDLQGGFSDVKTAQLGREATWLPATEVKGEGVFIALDETALKAWESRPAVKERSRALAAGHARWKKTLMGAHGIEFPGVRCYLLHALSHLLMSAISMECGYPASSIRERLYCRGHGEDGRAMAGILPVHWCRQQRGHPGRPGGPGQVLRRPPPGAPGTWRSCAPTDPSCSDHLPDDSLVDRNLDGAACHSCLYRGRALLRAVQQLSGPYPGGPHPQRREPGLFHGASVVAWQGFAGLSDKTLTRLIEDVASPETTAPAVRGRPAEPWHPRRLESP